MKIDNINQRKLISTIFEYIKCDFKINKINTSFEIYSYKGFSYKGSIKSYILENKTDKEIKDIICENWFLKNITNNKIVIETLVLGEYTYNTHIKMYMTAIDYISIKKKTFGIREKSSFLENNEIFIIKDENLDNLLDTVRKLGDLLHIKGFPLNMLEKGHHNNYNLLDVAYDGNSFIYTKVFDNNTMLSMARKLYSESNNHKPFWRKYLETPYAMKYLDNPLHKERIDELKLFSYSIDGECYRGKGYDSWKADINEVIISDTELDMKKLSKIILEILPHDVEDILFFNINEIEVDHTDTTSTFIEVRKDEKYITRENNYKYKSII